MTPFLRRHQGGRTPGLEHDFSKERLIDLAGVEVGCPFQLAVAFTDPISPAFLPLHLATYPNVGNIPGTRNQCNIPRHFILNEKSVLGQYLVCMNN